MNRLDDRDLLDDPRWPFVLHWWYRKRKEVLRLMRGIMPQLRAFSGKFVELGCGGGHDLCLIYRAFSHHLPSWKFFGCDADPGSAESIAQALARQGITPSAISFLQVDLVEKLPFNDNSVHMIYCSEVVEHLKEPRNLLAEVERVITPGGFLLITTPNQPSPLELGFYTRHKSDEMIGHEEQVVLKPNLESGAEAREVSLFGHVSVKTASEWRWIIEKSGLMPLAVGRGALRYDLPNWQKSYLGITGYFLLECIADLFPRRMLYKLGSQYIALYRKD